ncbi:DUF3180 domain-containing protein [Luteimicrobium subarcticum]|uniref:Uncharacterized protein DUF3180 n=1 Tax=Luteimicrobium subarcticum TaxID=620910 RepID=A0A2M8WSR6_9MICO|nr:DUF3180 domain-containing protein [Luteimicrobium subarcticum]PJI93944.1 uncharacterized protein DUF3180 [Luteimicrobium subarcticum]
MRRTSVGVLVVLAVVAALVGWVVVGALESRGTFLPRVPWVVDVAIVLLAGAVFWAGWGVRAYQKGDRPRLDGIRAARTFVLGKAAAVTGSVLVGWYLGQVLPALGDLDVEARREKAIAAGVAALAALVLAVAGHVVERFCELPPTDGDERGGGGARMSA